MHDQLTEAVERAAEYGAPPKTWDVGPNAVVDNSAASKPEVDPRHITAAQIWDETTITQWQLDR